MIDTVFGIKVKNQVYVLIGNRPIRLLDAAAIALSVHL